LGIIVITLVKRSSQSKLLQATILFLYLLQSIFYIKLLVDSASPYSFRLVHVFTTFLSCGIVVAILLTITRIMQASKALLLCAALVLSFCLAEVLATGFLHIFPEARPEQISRNPERVGDWLQHPKIGRIHKPHSEHLDYYPDNPRGYFKEEDSRKLRWKLHLHHNDKAKLVFAESSPDSVRIVIEELNSDIDWGIQASFESMAVQSGQQYSIRFRARADKPRKLGFGLSMAQAPWENLGFYRHTDLNREWTDYYFTFTAKTTYSNASICFNSGSDDSSVEIDSLSVTELQSQKNIVKPIPKKYYVSYQINDRHCRGPDYLIPKPSGTKRIIVLGDSYTFGQGVHQEDTFNHRMEAMFNDSGIDNANYEIINCGACGYDTRQERLFYESFASAYEPDLVIVSMCFNDDISWLEEVNKGYVYIPGKLDKIIVTLGLVRGFLVKQPQPDFSGCVDELLLLKSKLRENNIPLLVVIFRNSDWPPWPLLSKTVSEGLKGTGIPVLDIGNALLKNHSYADLAVHEIDGHPNEIAHRIAAETIYQLIKEKKLL